MSEKNIPAALLSVCISAIIVLSFTACGSGDKTVVYNDGTYSGRSSVFGEDESGNGAGYGEVSITVKDNKITKCSFKMYKPDGTIKDEKYGSDLSRENRLKAQKAVQSAEKYAAAVIGKGSAEDIDAISGATISCKEFKEAVSDALKKAEKKQ